MSLSEREKEILSLACLSNRQIAKKLNLSLLTIQRYFVNMYEKYGMNTKSRNKTKLLFEAIKAGELNVIDCGFWNSFGQYVEDLQIVDLRKE